MALVAAVAVARPIPEDVTSDIWLTCVLGIVPRLGPYMKAASKGMADLLELLLLLLLGLNATATGLLGTSAAAAVSTRNRLGDWDW